MTKFMLFGGDSYYPSGGMGDYLGTYDSIEEAKGGGGERCDWAHVVDMDTLVTVASWLKPYEKRPDPGNFRKPLFPENRKMNEEIDKMNERRGWREGNGRIN